jgi:hypothetical protein
VPLLNVEDASLQSELSDSHSALFMAIEPFSELHHGPASNKSLKRVSMAMKRVSMAMPSSLKRASVALPNC